MALELEDKVRSIAKDLGFDECRFSVARKATHANQFQAWLDDGQNGKYLRRFARTRNGNQKIPWGNHSEVAMTSFSRVDEKGGSASACQCGRDFAADVARFTHTNEHHPPRTGQNPFAGGIEGLVNSCR